MQHKTFCQTSLFIKLKTESKYLDYKESYAIFGSGTYKTITLYVEKLIITLVI